MDSSNRSIYVGLPRNEFTEHKPTELQDRLCIYFQRTNVSHSDVDGVFSTDIGTDDKLWMKVVFSDPSGIRHVLSKTQHELRMEGRTVIPLEVKEFLPPESIMDSQEEQFVEVTGFVPSSEELLKMHFENSRRSGGGDIKTWEHDPKTGAIRMSFENPSLVSEVVAKQHKVGGATLSVKLVVKKKPRPRPVNKRCMLLKGIPDGCTSDLVTIFVENRCGKDDLEIRYGEMPGTALCTFNEDIEDLENVIKKISLKKLKGVYVTAEKVHESDCILVQGLSSRVSLEMIELYFDNKKKSGGEGVRDVQQGPDETQAIVFFDDWKVVRDVLSKKGPHKVGGTELSIEEYHECFGRISPLDVPTPHIPKPVSVQVSQPVMEFIFGQKGQHTKKILAQKLSDVKAILKWPNGDDKTAARLDPLEEDGQRQSSWLKWPEVAPEALKDFLNRFKSSKIAIPAPLWKDTVARIDQLDTKGFSIELDVTQHIVNLVGMKQVVETGTNDINKIIKELKEKAEYEAQQTKQDVLLTAEKFQPFIICGIKDKIENAFPGLKITVTTSQGKANLIFEGTRKTVQEAELSMRRQIDNLEKLEFKAGKNKVQFVQSLEDKIHEILGSRGIRAACNGSDDGKIIISGATRKDATQAKAFIVQEIEEGVIPIEDQAVLAVLKGQEGSDLLGEAKKQRLVVANISQEQDVVEIVGVKTNLEEVKQSIIAFLTARAIDTEFISTSTNKISAIIKHHGQSLKDLVKQHKHKHLKITQESGSRTGFLIEGNEEGLTIARRFLNSLVERIEDAAPLSMSSESLTKIQSSKTSPDKEATKEMPLLASSNEIAKDSTPKMCLQDIGPLAFQNLWAALAGQASLHSFTFATVEGMKIMVCQGDITRQSVQAVVNLTDPKLDNTEGVSRALVSAAGTPLQRYCLDIIKSRGNKVLDNAECILTPGFNLKFRFVIHVVVSSDSDPNYNKNLYDTFMNCLLVAEKNEILSLAIPFVGSGSAGSPKDICADILVLALLDFSRQSSKNLREVMLVNIDQVSPAAVGQFVVSYEGNPVMKKDPDTESAASDFKMCYDNNEDFSEENPDLQTSCSFSKQPDGSDDFLDICSPQMEVILASAKGECDDKSQKARSSLSSLDGRIFGKTGVDNVRFKASDNVVFLDNDTYNFLNKFEDVALQQIKKRHKVQIKVSKVDGGGLEALIVPSSYRALTSTESIAEAKDEFIELYQRVHVSILRKMVDCSSLGSEATIEKAVTETLQKFKVDTVITRVDEIPHCRLILTRGDVEEVARHFLASIGNKRGKNSMGSGLWMYHIPTVTCSSKDINFANDKNNECPICLADEIIDEVELKCKHRFCKGCIEKALKISYRCPVCQVVCRSPRGNQPHGILTDLVDTGCANKTKAKAPARSANEKNHYCPICLADKMKNEVELKCKHRFCSGCIEEAFKRSYKCPICYAVCRPPKGNQPPGGTMRHTTDQYMHLPGHENHGVITIHYSIPRGTQSADHPNPGRYFTGTSRTAYLPDNPEGREVLRLLRKAFDAGLVFTVGQSHTTGLSDTVTWNDIHHKTCRSGGPSNFGYPDPGYLKRVKEELSAKGIA